MPGRVADQEDFVKTSQLLIYSEGNSCISKVCTISCQVWTRAFARAVPGAGVGNHTEAIASAQALAINRHLDVTRIKSNERIK